MTKAAGSEAHPSFTPSDYRHWIEDQVRYADLDTLGHCNSAVYSTFFESARVAIFTQLGYPMGAQGLALSIVRQTIEYRRELVAGARLRIGTRVAKLGRTSITLANAVFEGESCAATGEVVGVVISLATRRPAELPADLRAGLEALF